MSLSLLFALSLSAFAETPTHFEVEVELSHDESLSSDVYDVLLEDAAGRAPLGTLSVDVVARDPETGRVRSLQDLIPPVAGALDKQGERAVRTPYNDVVGESQGQLSGKAVYLSQCHGWIYYETLGRFSTQRGNLFDTVEDFHNPEGANQFLTAYLQNAGAQVFTVKERDLNPNSAIADNDGEGYSETGSGFGDGLDGNDGFADANTFAYGVNPFDAGTTRRLPADGGAVATWIPEVPVDDFYAVYVSWDSHSQNATDAHYQITHPGGVIDRHFDQTVHGATWQYVDTLWLPQGVEGFKVELVGDSSQAGKYLSADAVRIGGGTGQVTRHGGTTGRPRWEQGAILHTQYNGAPTSVYDPGNDGDGSDPSSRARWAAWEHPTGEDALYLSWHSNAGGGVGTSVYTYDGAATAGSEELGDLLVEEIVDTSRTLWDSGWTDRGHRYANFSEVNPNSNSEMPAALIELAFHDSDTDIVALKSPTYRRDASRAMYRAIVRYFAERDSEAAAFSPEPPIGLSITHNASGELEASWQAGISGTPFGNPATSYRIYTSADGLSWDNGTEVSGTSTLIDVPTGTTVFVRVVAVNAGGWSFPTEVVGARRSTGGSADVLIVGAFDRLDNGMLVTRDVGPVGTVKGMDLTRMNRGDSAAIHGRAVSAAGYPFDTVTDEVFDGLNIDDYGVVVWVAGEESTSDETFTAAQQTKLTAFVGAGGALWASGAEILWDLDSRGDAADQEFAANVLGAGMAADDAGTTVVTGAGLLDGVGAMDFGESAGAPYPVEWPDVLDTSRTVIATYGDGATAGALGNNVALFGFPFETIGDAAVRDEVAARLLGELIDGGRDTGPFGDSGGGDTGDVVDPRTPIDRGCGCQSTPSPFTALWLVPLALVRRRR
ncbi:MAG: N-acetylmuramoyl-L-alanine amidase [Proteobacteria bacterium]|nr:N-acetylmuramoyl-L-alanine amidase [Pseudomonadota bacterium]